MRELSLHVLDLVENSLRAGARTVRVSVTEEPSRDLLAIGVEDDGPGLAVAAGRAADPFFTTKAGKKTGLGLSLFQAAAQRAGGALELARSELGGLAVRATLGLRHVDRQPLGDLAGTLSAMLFGRPEVDLQVCLRVGDRQWQESSGRLARELSAKGGGETAVPLAMGRRIREGLAALRIET